MEETDWNDRELTALITMFFFSICPTHSINQFFPTLQRYQLISD